MTSIKIAPTIRSILTCSGGLSGRFIPVMDKVATVWFARSIEASLEIIAKLLGVYLVYRMFNYIGQQMLGESFSQDTLLSLLLLPTLYILTELPSIIEPFVVKVQKSESRVSVISGIVPRVADTLDLESVDNIEIIKTPMGFLFNYGSIRLFGLGGSVEMPFVKNAEQVSKTISLGRSKKF